MESEELRLKSRPIILSANEAWYLVNFRGPLISALIEAGYDVVAAANPDPEQELRLKALGCRFSPISVDNKGLSIRRDLATVRAYRDLMRRERPAAFLGSTIKPNIYGSLAAAGTATPVINTITGLGTAFIRRTWLTHVVERLYRVALRRSHAIFFQNAADRALFVDRRLVRPSQTRLVPGSGIDLDQFTPDPSAKADGGAGVTFLLIARLVRDKGVLEFVEAARLIRRTHPNVRCQILGFLNVANRTAIARSEVERWVKDGEIEFIDAVPDVRPYIAAADCVVLPSYREGTSRVLLEAAAMGKPLIATDVPGCRETIDPEVTGYLCRLRDAESLAQAMNRMATASPQVRSKMGMAGRAKMVREFDQGIVISQYVQAIAECAEK